MRVLLILLIILGGMAVQAESDEVTLDGVKSEQIEIPKKNIDMKGSLVLSDEQVMQELVRQQKEKDMEDIENLWKGTVDNNQVIGFALTQNSCFFDVKNLVGTCCGSFFRSFFNWSKLHDPNSFVCRRQISSKFD